MTARPEVLTLHRAIDDLHRSVSSLRTAYGDVPAVRRLVNDTERLDIDIADVDALPAPKPVQVPHIETVPDEPYDPAVWAGVDDEGVGGYRGTDR